MADDIAISNYLESQKIKQSNLGFIYLTTAIQLATDSHLKKIKIADLYEKIADVHCTKASAVERAIRYSLLKKDITSKEFIVTTINKMDACNQKWILQNRTGKMWEGKPAKGLPSHLFVLEPKYGKR